MLTPSPCLDVLKSKSREVNRYPSLLFGCCRGRGGEENDHIK